jgi:hypothetical protein
VVGAWAQAKEHSDAGIAIVRAEFEAHKGEESAARRATEAQMTEVKKELYEMRKEQRAIYDYMKTGRDQPILEQPLVVPDGGR